MSRKKLIILVVLAVLAAASFGFYWWKTTTSQERLEEHIASAEEFERVHDYDKAINELKEALKYVAVNDEETRSELEQKLEELQQKVEQSKAAASSESPGGTQDGQQPAGEDGSDGDTGTEPSGQEDTSTEPESVSITMLGALLPTDFSGIKGNLSDGEGVASVRFDDLASDSTYLVYVYRQADPEAADRLVESVTQNVYNVGVQEIELRGEFEGFKGLFALNEQGDAGIFFAYGPLNFECLVRTTTLSDEQKLSRLKELQSLIKKP